MKFEIVELNEFSGAKASIHSIFIDDADFTLFDKFIQENHLLYPDELGSIIDRLEIIGHFTGAREHYFKLNEAFLKELLRHLEQEIYGGLRTKIVWKEHLFLKTKTLIII